MTEQYELEIGYKGETVIEAADASRFEGMLGYCHQRNTFAWIYCDGLRFKYNRHTDEDGTHYVLFGSIVSVVPYRGWYVPAKKLVTIAQRYPNRDFETPEEIPEHLYRALRRQFNPQHWRVL
jgi:hypothetical protein